MKRIDINNKGKYPFTVREDDRVNSCHTVEIEGPCKIYITRTERLGQKQKLLYIS